jgi:uncharacterized membrane protein
MSGLRAVAGPSGPAAGDDDPVTDETRPEDERLREGPPERGDVHERLDRLERLAVRDVQRAALPAWRRHTRGEQRWPFAVAILVMIGLQSFLPERLSAGPRWALPLIEVLIIVVLMLANPGRMERSSPALRKAGLALITVASVGNAWSVAWLVADIVLGRNEGTAGALLATGGNVWLINVLTFAVWYWEFDRGGPLERALGTHPDPDFLFAQMGTPDMASADWEPEFLDYLYLAFTNSTAFSPTDTLPLSRWAKSAMLAQSAISLVTAALVVAKAVNALQ